ncbi:MAG: GyrI-like domain-containing protein [Bullifex sp.]
MKTTSISRDMVTKAITYILSNLEEDIGVDDVASYCAVSKYHLSRVFREETGEAPYQFIMRSKLERSAWRLKVEKQRSITDIGYDYGYSPSNFATVFRKMYSTTPSDFRRTSKNRVRESSFSHSVFAEELGSIMSGITIRKLPDIYVIYELKKGNYHDLASEWDCFVQKYIHLADENTRYIECTIDDPSITDEDSCLYQLCQTISPDDPAIIREELNTTVFEGGKYAVCPYSGYPQFIFPVYQEVFSVWLEKTGNILAEKPIFDIYTFVREDLYMEMEICFPLK